MTSSVTLTELPSVLISEFISLLYELNVTQKRRGKSFIMFKVMDMTTVYVLL